MDRHTKKFETCLRRNNPIRDNIFDCWINEIVVIDFLKDELFYSERWRMFTIEYDESSKTFSLSNKDNLMNKDSNYSNFSSRKK